MKTDWMDTRGTWTTCPGSGQPPTDLQPRPFGLYGLCHTCQRWVRVTPRGQTLYRHAARGLT